MLRDIITEIKEMKGVCVSKETNYSVCGKIETEGKKKIKFWFTWSDHCIHMGIRDKHKELMEKITREVGKPYIQWEINRWFSTDIVYAWEKDLELRENFFRLLRLKIALKNGLFSFLGHRNAQLLNT